MDSRIESQKKYLRHFHKWVPLFICVVAIVFFWSTAVSTSWARISALQTIEGYAMAVHEQLMLQFFETGSFSQTIHKGYDDAWTWSGHRSLTLPIMAQIYGLSPSPVWLSIIMITFVTLGCIATGGLAKKILANNWGWPLGVLIYLGCPASMALALQDYQDLIFALPAITFCCWMMSMNRWYWTLIGVCIGIMPREECVPIVIAVAGVMIPFKNYRPQWKPWLLNITIAASIAFGYVSWAESAYPIATSGHDMPLENALRSLGHQQIFLEGWLYKTRFYSLIWIPIGTIAILSPFVAAPALALSVLHMTVPEGHGVDRSWSGHCHHMAPAVAFAVCATTIGAARFMNILKRWPLRQVSIPIVAAISFIWMSWWWHSWSGYYNLRTGFLPTEPEWKHPVWNLIEQLDKSDIPIVSKNTALAASHFPKSYTFDESLYQKESRRGVSAGTHIILDKRRQDVMQWVQSLNTITLIDEIEEFQLYSIEKGTRDIWTTKPPKFKKPPAYTGEFSKAEQIPGVAPHEQRIKVIPGSFPVIQF